MFETVFTSMTIVALLYVLVRDLLPPAFAFLGALVSVLLAGIISTEEAFSGFSSPVIFVVASLFVIAKAIQNSINSPKAANKLLGDKFNRVAMMKLVIPVSIASAAVANTPVVASLIQPLEEWSRKHNISISKLLMPLSFAAILGGTLTLIGTSTNLVVSGLLSEAGYGQLGLFEVTKISLPVVAVGLLVILLIIPRLLPNSKSIRKNAIKNSVVEYVVAKHIAGKTVSGAGLRNLSKLYLTSIIRRDGDVISVVSPSTILKQGDTLQFVGDIKDMTSLQDFDGLSVKAQKHQNELFLKNVAQYEVVLGHDSKVLNKTMKESNFRGFYQAAVFAIHRSGEKLVGKLGEIKLKVGDTLLLVSDEYFEERWTGKSDFLLINKLENTKRIHNENFLKLTAIGLIVIGLTIFTSITFITALMTIALLSVFTGIVTMNEARKSLDFDLLIMIAASISFATAIVNSGLSVHIADGLTKLFGNYGAQGLLLSIIIAALILTELITNTAAASLLFPIAIASAVATGSDVRIFAIVLAIACSLSFLSPFGYQTNTMVLGPGGYKFTDYLKAGSALTVTTALVLFFVSSSML